MEWQWLDGNEDGIAECYAFDREGWMYADTATPDGYTVNTDGAWAVNGADTAGEHGWKADPDRVFLSYRYDTGNRKGDPGGSRRRSV